MIQQNLDASVIALPELSIFPHSPKSQSLFAVYLLVIFLTHLFLQIEAFGILQWFYFAIIKPPVGIYWLKVNSGNSRTMNEICSKLALNTLKRHQWHHILWAGKCRLSSGIGLEFVYISCSELLWLCPNYALASEM